MEEYARNVRTSGPKHLSYREASTTYYVIYCCVIDAYPTYMIIRSNSSGIHELQSAQAIHFEGCFQHPPAGGVKHPSRVAENGTWLKVCEKNILRADSMLFRIFQVCLDHDILPQQHKPARKHQVFFQGLMTLWSTVPTQGKGCFGAFSKTTPSHSMALPQLVAPNIVAKPRRSDHRLNMDKNGLGFVQHWIVMNKILKVDLCLETPCFFPHLSGEGC